MLKTKLLSRKRHLAVAVSGALALFASVPTQASTLRIAMTAADIPLTLGQPDQGFEGNRFTGIPLYDALVGFSPCVRGLNFTMVLRSTPMPSSGTWIRC